MKNKYKIDGDIAVIYLKKRDGTIYKCFVSSTRMPELMKYGGTWSAREIRGNVYAVRSNEYLHRWLTNCPNDKEVDHTNRNSLDNTDRNLLVCSRSSNQRNRTQKTNKSGISGVHWNNSKKRWIVHISSNGKQKDYGSYIRLLDAAFQALSVRNRLSEIPPTRIPILFNRKDIIDRPSTATMSRS